MGEVAQVPARQMSVAFGICHAFGAARDLHETAIWVDRWAREALDTDDVSTRLWLPNGSGRLRAVGGRMSPRTHRRWAGPRKAFFARREVGGSRRPDGSTLFALPPVQRQRPRCAGGPRPSGRPLVGTGLARPPAQTAIVVHNFNQQAAALTRERERFDLGISWTAHELRGPWTGARATVDDLLSHPATVEETRLKLVDLGAELAYLYELVESTLGWRSEARNLQFAPVDLVRVAKEAVRSCSAETREDRVVIIARKPSP
jgi:hypothetical protein